MKRFHYAIIVAEFLSYGLIVTFILADGMFDLTGILRAEGTGLSSSLAPAAACLVGIVGTINLWLTIYYMQKAHTMRDWIVLCAWTHRVKCGGQWMKLEDFLTEQFGCQITHGMSADAFKKLTNELDERWRDIKCDVDQSVGAPAISQETAAATPTGR